MGWSTGIPSVSATDRSAPSPQPGGSPGGDRPSAWVPSSGQRTGGAEVARGEALVYLLAGAGYLVLFVVLVVVSALDQWGSGSRSLDALLQSRDAVLGLGWVGMFTTGLTVWLLPTLTGIPVRPRPLIRTHLAMANMALVLYLIADLGFGAGSSITNLFLIIAALSYVLIAIPLLRALLLAIGDLRAGLL
ncbi:MAG: hypothetical protein L3K04_06665 [Thermoplasmata archaeon]|nr:hypothetical protein [Thermoplasmata archaeon]MCI4342026.1 hypothetical protein [Thermoplasmata archaeon]